MTPTTKEQFIDFAGDEPEAWPTVPDSVMAYIQAYGDSRADDDGFSGLRSSEMVYALRRWAASVAGFTALEQP